MPSTMASRTHSRDFSPFAFTAVTVSLHSGMAVEFRQPDGSESPLLPQELSLLISDTLESPATFLVVQHLALALKARRPCVLVGLAQSFEYYTAVLRKQGVQLPHEREKGNLVYIDTAQLLVDEYDGFAMALQTQIGQALNARTPDQITSEPRPPLVALDDFASLLHAGLAPLALLKLFRNIRGMARQSSASLLVVYHDDAFSPGRTNIERSEEDHFLLRNLIQLSDFWIQTRSLRAQMTGELVLHRAPALAGLQSDLVTHSLNRPLQYKLEETGPTYFAKGTGKGFL